MKKKFFSHIKILHEGNFFSVDHKRRRTFFLIIFLKNYLDDKILLHFISKLAA